MSIEVDRNAIIGYALGTGLVFVPLLGIPLRFAFQSLPASAVYAGAFLLGVLVGAAVASRRSSRLRD